jgi:hypothetical protein
LKSSKLAFFSDPCKGWEKFKKEGVEKWKQYNEFVKSDKKDQATIDEWKKTTSDYYDKLQTFKDLKKADGTPCVSGYDGYLENAKKWKESAAKLEPSK